MVLASPPPVVLITPVGGLVGASRRRARVSRKLQEVRPAAPGAEQGTPRWRASPRREPRMAQRLALFACGHAQLSVRQPVRADKVVRDEVDAGLPGGPHTGRWSPPACLLRRGSWTASSVTTTTKGPRPSVHSTPWATGSGCCRGSRVLTILEEDLSRSCPRWASPSRTSPARIVRARGSPPTPSPARASPRPPRGGRGPPRARGRPLHHRLR